jgi:hypothetical protein
VSFASTAATGASPYDQMKALASAVHDAFGYDPTAAAGQSYGRLSTLVTYGKDTKSPASASADAFATLFAVAAREAGYPSRLVVGFAPAGDPTSANTYTITGANVRVWPEVYFTGVGWVPFYGAVPAGNGTGSSGSPVEQPTGGPTTLVTAATSASAAPYTGPSVHISNSKPGRKAASPLPVLLGVFAGIVVAGFFGYVLAMALTRNRRRAARRAEPDPRRRTEFAWLESLDALGYTPRSTVTPRELADNAPNVLGDDGTEPIRRLAGLAETAAYAPDPPRHEQADVTGP